MNKTITLGLTLLLMVSACSSNRPAKLNMMAAPEIYHEDRFAPFDDKDIEAIERPVKLFYATDRSRSEPVEEWPYYLNERGHLLRLGQASITMSGGNYDWEQIKEISLQRNRPSKYHLQISGIEDFGVLDKGMHRLDRDWFNLHKYADPRQQYTDAINRRLASSPVKDIYIYTHGYRVTFDYPLLVSGELWHFLGYQGVFIAYSWPATPSALAYSSDLESARYTSRNFRLFLEYLATHTDAERIHLIGYSAGNRVIIDTLWQMAVMHEGESAAQLQQRYRIGDVMVMASDYDVNLFYSAVREGILKVPQRMTVYRSKTDRALSFATWWLSRQRLGEIRTDVALTLEQHKLLGPEEQIELIDVTQAEQAGAGKGHDYFRNSPWVSSDVLMTLRYDLPPEKRGLVREEGMATWTFPDDYIERLRVSLSEMLEAEAN